MENETMEKGPFLYKKELAFTDLPTKIDRISTPLFAMITSEREITSPVFKNKGNTYRVIEKLGV